ncbi:MAG: IucA/IucC family C-terminal-domain containing protein [Actinomycetota bacterium]|nr:IucA/IucC family C-terminal-domain containing protein [Actinomycetota bacterium]
MTAGERNGATGVATAAEGLAGLVSYLRVSVGRRSDDADGWLDCGALVDDPERLRTVFLECGAGRGTEDPQVAASLFVQAWAFRAAAAALGCWWVGGVVPDLDPHRCAITLGRHRPNAIDLDGAASGTGHDAAAIGAAVVDHLAPVVDAVRATTTVGERLLWGNTAASVAAAARTLDGVIEPADRHRLRAMATAVLGDSAPEQLRGLGRFTSGADDAAAEWRWARTNCCLNHQLPERRLCDDCPLDAPPEPPAPSRHPRDSL